MTTLTHIGPTTIPEIMTLGWEAMGWTRKYLEQPDGPNAGAAWDFTDEQIGFVANWFAIDKQGVFVYRNGMLRRMKGWGKDPLGAVLCALELVGPCRFGGWKSDGTPRAIQQPAAWVQVAAVSRDQTRNTMTLFPSLFSKRAVEEYGIDIGKEIIYAERGTRRIEAVTSSPRALEGQRSTFVLKNETHHWLSNNEGLEMAAAIRRNTSKIRDAGGRYLSISNAHAPGENSDAEHDYEAWKQIEAGTSKATGMLYDSLEAPETDLLDDVSLRAGIEAARGDSHWLDVDRLMAEIRDPRTSPAMARRFYLNQIVAEEDKPFDRKKWGELSRRYLPADGSLIVLGFDGSLTRDHTALIATDCLTGHQWTAGYWEPRDVGGEIRIPFLEVDQTVDALFERYQVWRLNADPYKWGQLIDAWAGRWSEDIIVKWNTTNYRKMALSLQNYSVAISTGGLTHDGDPRFAASIANSHKRMLTMRDDDGEYLWLIQKERPDSPLKIDAAIAGCLSWEAYTAAVAAGATVQEESTVMFV